MEGIETKAPAGIVSAPTHQLKNKLINYPPAWAEMAAAKSTPTHPAYRETNSPEVYTPWAPAVD